MIYKGQLLNDFEVTDPMPLWTKGTECSSVLKSCVLKREHVSLSDLKRPIHIYTCNVFNEN